MSNRLYNKQTANCRSGSTAKIGSYGRGQNDIPKAVEAGAIIQSGSWFSYKEDKIAQGKENLRQKLKEDTKLKKAIQKDVMGYLGL